MCALTEKISRAEVAAKCVLKKFVKKNEELLWSQLHHLKILPLLETITTPEFTVYISPKQTSYLFDLVNRKTLSLPAISGYLSDTLEGLQYLHCIGLCHLNLKSNHIIALSASRERRSLNSGL